LPLTNCSFNKNGDKYDSNYLGLSQVVMIELAKFGIHKLEIFYIH